MKSKRSRSKRSLQVQRRPIYLRLEERRVMDGAGFGSFELHGLHSQPNREVAEVQSYRIPIVESRSSISYAMDSIRLDSFERSAFHSSPMEARMRSFEMFFSSQRELRELLDGEGEPTEFLITSSNRKPFELNSEFKDFALKESSSTFDYPTSQNRDTPASNTPASNTQPSSASASGPAQTSSSQSLPSSSVGPHNPSPTSVGLTTQNLSTPIQLGTISILIGQTVPRTSPTGQVRSISVDPRGASNVIAASGNASSSLPQSRGEPSIASVFATPLPDLSNTGSKEVSRSLLSQTEIVGRSNALPYRNDSIRPSEARLYSYSDANSHSSFGNQYANTVEPWTSGSNRGSGKSNLSQSNWNSARSDADFENDSTSKIWGQGVPTSDLIGNQSIGILQYLRGVGTESGNGFEESELAASGEDRGSVWIVWGMAAASLTVAALDVWRQRQRKNSEKPDSDCAWVVGIHPALAPLMHDWNADARFVD